MTRDDLMMLIAPIIAPLKRRIAGMISRGAITRVDDNSKTQRVQATGFASEKHDGVERFQPYGFSSVPDGAEEALFFSVGGDRGHLICFTNDPKHRPTGMKTGDVAFYDKRGNKITLTKDGISIESAAPIKIEKGADFGLATDAPVLASLFEEALKTITPTQNDGGAAVIAALIQALHGGALSSKTIKAD